jgi:DNA-binding NarL/FixJ family response regulator
VGVDTIFVSRATPLHPDIKHFLECYRFGKVVVTASEKDGLYSLIRELNPRFVMMSASFHEAGTPYMLGKIVKMFPKIRTAAVSTDNFPLTRAVSFKLRGVNAFINKWEGTAEFEKGLKLFRDGEDYYSPMLEKLISHSHKYSDIDRDMSERLLACLIMLCSGFKTERIGNNLHISKSTVENHLQCLYDTFHVTNREEMVGIAWRLKLVTDEDIRFYDDRVINFPLPNWAIEKIHLDKTAKELNLLGFTA